MFKFLTKKNSRAAFGRMAVRDRFLDIKDRIKTESPLIVDGGANRGGMIDLFLRQYKNPLIHAFEPIPDLVNELQAKYRGNKKVVIHGNALGTVAKKISFNITNNLVSSSVLTPTAINRGYHKEKMDISRTVEVAQIRLDDVLDKEIEILKLDLQGYELEALTGCEKLLGRIKTITTEIEFVPLYEGQPLFSDIDVFLRSKGFKLLNMYELYTHPDGQLTAGDAVYLNTKYF